MDRDMLRLHLACDHGYRPHELDAIFDAPAGSHWTPDREHAGAHRGVLPGVTPEFPIPHSHREG